MEQLSTNLKYLRLRKRLSQPKLGASIQLNASTISAYEKGRSIPRLQNLLKLSNYFNRRIDDLLNMDIEATERQKLADTKGDNLRVLPIVVDEQNEEMITLVPVKAAAGYLEGYSDAEFIGDLPNFRLPFSELSENKTYRAFQIEGDSMLPIPSGAYIICEFLQDWETIKDGSTHVVITNDDGIVYKRIEKDLEENQLILHSDNRDYHPFEVSLNQVLEVWKALGYVCFDLP
ncbi:MAG: S24 family peptidase [Marinifilaceae bacterium]